MKKKFIILENIEEEGAECIIVESESAPKALFNYLDELFNLNDPWMSDEDICNNMLRNEFFAVAPINKVGPVDFQYYNSIDEIKKEIK